MNRSARPDYRGSGPAGWQQRSYAGSDGPMCSDRDHGARRTSGIEIQNETYLLPNRNLGPELRHVRSCKGKSSEQG